MVTAISRYGPRVIPNTIQIIAYRAIHSFIRIDLASGLTRGRNAV